MKPRTQLKLSHLKLVTGDGGKLALNCSQANAAIPAPPVHLTGDAIEE